MKKLLLFTIALVFILFCAPVQAANVNTVKAAIVKHSIEMGVDPAITLSIAKTESGFRHEAKSAHGAVGVFQLMPSTARRMGLNPYLLDDNIKGGIMYYKSMYKMFGSVELALAAYNAGPGNVKKYRAVPPFSETRRFVSRIMTDYRHLKAHPDPAMIAAEKQQTIAAKPVSAPVTPAPVKQEPVAPVVPAAPKVIAVAPGRTAPLPAAKAEQTGNLHVEDMLKGIPMEAAVKSQSVAI